ncbi:uncharacterized protein MELLADRAFT_104276 [Melampsora larici-populina 98AG31]|uniref:Secreted protein n=1 Tax=Melampsora larici-populina (strain 98AG31 / pathotype 3-4-7) TaxID=747676 RepID=F4RE67_MELLP|nr:uncharacterized protein MELLADRAFT_104276 [Melampsora larici-populina 98AG31]EGG09324.1 hypothetical protein MELLADRAFT_104276 [Melampsora larici-populina 98AG31]
MLFSRHSLSLVFLALSHAVAPHSLPATLLEELGRTSKLDHLDPESIVTCRWDGNKPDSYREPRWMHNQNVFLPLATSLFDKIRKHNALRTDPIGDKEKYSTPEDVLLMLIKIAMQPTNDEVNKPWELSMHQAVNYLNAEMQLLSYFTQVDREVFRNLHRDDEFLNTIVQFHALECQRAGSRGWLGSLADTPVLLSNELADRIVPANLWPLADYYQDYDRLLNEGQGELKERLDRFLFTNFMSRSVYGPNQYVNPGITLARRINQLPTGWWLSSSQTEVEGEVTQLIKDLIESIRSDYTAAATALREQRSTSPRLNIHSYQHSPAHNPTIGQQTSILSRFQAAQHLCRYLGVDFDQVFSSQIQEHGHVRVWLRFLAANWSRSYSIPRRASSLRYVTPTG